MAPRYSRRKAAQSSTRTANPSSSTMGGNAAHRSSIQLSSYFDRWRADGRTFLRDAFRDPTNGGPIQVAPWVDDFFAAKKTHDYISTRAARGVGKTACVVLSTFHDLIAFRPSTVVITATRKEQLSITNWKEANLWLSAMDSSLRSELTILKQEIRVKGCESNIAVATTASKGAIEALQGLHSSERFTWVVDEAAGVEEHVFDAGLGSMTTAGSSMYLFANPRLTSGMFYRTQTHSALADIWHRIKVSAFDVKGMPYYRADLIEELRRMWGEDSWQWYAYVLGEFPPSQEGSVIPLRYISEALYRNAVNPEGYRPIWGFDPARSSGGDKSALAKRHCNILLEPVQTWTCEDYSVSVDRIVAEFMEAKEAGLEPAMICIDTTGGYGVGPLRSLRALNIPVMAVEMAGMARNHYSYLNRRAEIWMAAREWFVAGGCSIPDDELLIEELAAPKMMLGGTGNAQTKIQAKADIRTIIGRSTDRADAFCLTFAAPAYEIDHFHRRKDTELSQRMKARRRLSGKITWQGVC